MAASADSATPELKALQELQTHVRGLAEELKTEREARAEERKRGVSVTSIHVPLLLTLGLFVFGLSAAGAGAVFVYDSKAHMASKKEHASPEKVDSRGGLAYVADVKEAVSAEESDREAKDRELSREVSKFVDCKISNVGRSGRKAFECAAPNPYPLLKEHL